MFWINSPTLWRQIHRYAVSPNFSDIRLSSFTVKNCRVQNKDIKFAYQFIGKVFLYGLYFLLFPSQYGHNKLVSRIIFLLRPTLQSGTLLEVDLYILYIGINHFIRAADFTDT